MSVVPYSSNNNAGLQGFGAGGPGSPPMYGPPIKEKGPSMSTVISDNMAVAVAKTFRTAHKEVDIAIIKATTPKFPVVPKEKHVRTLKRAIHMGQPGSYGNYVIQKLMERLHETKNWLCALKVLMVFHRLMRESEGSSFVSELGKYGSLGYGGRGGALNMDAFNDTTSGVGRYDYSEWVRCYARFLDEQLSVFAKTSFYQEADGAAPAEGRMRSLPPNELLAQLPPLQKLLERLMDTLPRGAAARHYVVQAALLTVAKESFQIYRTISEGIINLADCFFDMAFAEAQQGLDIYKQHTVDNDRLGTFYAEAEKIEELKRSATFPKLTPPSPDFLGLMEDYVANAPRDGKAKTPTRDTDDKLPPTVDSGLSLTSEPEVEAVAEVDAEPVAEPTPPTPPPLAPEMDLLNFDEPEPEPQAPLPPREKTATELLEAEKSASNTPTMNNGGQPNGFTGGFTGGNIPQQSNNPFGEGASFGPTGGQQQGLPGGAVVPYGGSAFGAGQPGQGWGGAPQQQQQLGGYYPPSGNYGMQSGQPGGNYGMKPQGSYGVQPGQLVPYGSSGVASPGGYGGQPSPMGSFSQTPGGTTPGATGAAQQASSFRNAALSDPFADLGPVAQRQGPAQQTPPLREVSPTQQRINLGPGYGGGMQPQSSGGAWGNAPPQDHHQQQQQQQWGPQQPQQNGWNQPLPHQHHQGGHPQQNGYGHYPQGAPSPATPPQLQGGWQR